MARPVWLAGAALTLAIGAALPVAPARATPSESHAGHTAQMAGAVAQANYTLPDVKVTRQDGKRMSLAQALDDGRPVMLNFIYTSCNAICPVTSQIFTEVRERLGAERDKINMVSISIDPEQDTPRRLTAYAKRFGSAGTWAHYTSSSADAIEIQRAFGAWRGDKMNHQPSTYLRGAPGKAWVRLDGFFSPEDLVGHYLRATQGQGDDNCVEPAGQSAGSSMATPAAAKSPTASTSSALVVGLPAKARP